MAAKKTPKTKSSAKNKPAAKAAAKPAKRAAAKAAAPAASKGLQLTSAAPGITVDDIQASMAFYCDVLGFAVKQRWEREGTLTGAEITAGPISLYLGQDDWQKGRHRIKGQGFRLYWYTNQDVDKLAAAIKSRGGALASEPKDGYGTRSFDVHDPTGYNITISKAR